MWVISVITTLSAAVVAFYLRFLFALCKEIAPRWINYRTALWVRLEKWTGKNLPSKLGHSSAPLQITEMPLNIDFDELRKDRA